MRIAPFIPIALLVLAGAARAQVPDTTLWITDGEVTSMVHAPPFLYLGGWFHRVGPATGGGIPLSVAGGDPIAPFPKVTGEVFAIAGDGSGGRFIGGLFSRVGGRPRQALAHIRADGSVSEWSPNLAGQCLAIARSETTLFVAGWFSRPGVPQSISVAAFGTSDAAPLLWSMHATTAVNALALDAASDRLYIGGEFSFVDVSVRNRIAALVASTGALTAWNPNATGEVRAITTTGSTVFAGGAFTGIGGASRRYIAALDATTGLAKPWNALASGGVDGPGVHVLSLIGGTLYVGGSFDHMGGAARANIAALDTTDAGALAWNPGADGWVTAIDGDASTIYVGGSFSTLGGESRAWLGAVDVNTGSTTAWNPNPDGPVVAILREGDAIQVGGGFSIMGGVTRNGLAALDLSSGMATNWNPNADGAVLAMARREDVIYVGGHFSSIGGLLRNRIAAIDATSGDVAKWKPEADGVVRQIALAESTVYVAGDFSSIGNRARRHLAALSPTIGVATDWDPNPDEVVLALAVTATTVYAGGAFSEIGGASRRAIAALDAATGVATPWNPMPGDAYQEVYELTLRGSTIYVGGQFQHIGGRDRASIAELDLVTGAATDWNPSPYPPAVWVIQPTNGIVFVGGEFETVDGVVRRQVAALRASNGSALPWDPRALDILSLAWPTAMLPVGDTLYIVGQFDDMGGEPQAHVARILPVPGLLAVPRTDRPAPSFMDLRAWPNPSMASIRVDFWLTVEERGRLSVIDLAGREVAVLADGRMTAGPHSVEWKWSSEESALPSGVYFVSWRSPGSTISRRILLLR